MVRKYSVVLEHIERAMDQVILAVAGSCSRYGAMAEKANAHEMWVFALMK